jgi:probable rRNA maturation factor
MPIAVTSLCRRRGVRSASVRADAVRLLRELNAEAELSVALVDDAAMQALNATYRNKNQPTDVLAFSMREGDATPRSDLLGDVVISVDTAARQATERGVSVAAEVRTLLTHGILHLLGYDHERSAVDARGMFALQDRLVRLLEREDSK